MANGRPTDPAWRNGQRFDVMKYWPLIALVFAILVQAVEARMRISHLETTVTKLESESRDDLKSLARMERILCRICSTSLGGDSCSDICGG